MCSTLATLVTLYEEIFDTENGVHCVALGMYSVNMWRWFSSGHREVLGVCVVFTGAHQTGSTGITSALSATCSLLSLPLPQPFYMETSQKDATTHLALLTIGSCLLACILPDVSFSYIHMDSPKFQLHWVFTEDATFLACSLYLFIVHVDYPFMNAQLHVTYVL